MSSCDVLAKFSRDGIPDIAAWRGDRQILKAVATICITTMNVLHRTDLCQVMRALQFSEKELATISRDWENQCTSGNK